MGFEVIAAVIVSDRGDQYLHGCLASMQQIDGEMTSVFVDDSAHKLGMAGAVRQGWEEALDLGADYVLHVEEDFLFTHPVRLDDLIYVLDRNPNLAQVVLKRQPWSDEEKRAGGIVEMDPSIYSEFTSWGRRISWTEHARIFSLNPCLVPRSVLEMGWPDGNEAEFTQMCRDRGLRFAFFGTKHAPPVVEHVGVNRAHGWRL